MTPIVELIRTFYLRDAVKNAASEQASEPVAADCSVTEPAPAELAVDAAPTAAVVVATKATVYDPAVCR